jgi:hypothetical protein|tara:strand:+ start:629 stop:865 length:237 start_codon:yes stop_codon:yes gene_type:complete
MAKPHSLNYKNIERLRNLYERHCELLDLKFREDIAEQRGVLLGLDMVLEITQSIEEFQRDIKKINGEKSGDKHKKGKT